MKACGWLLGAGAGLLIPLAALAAQPLVERPADPVATQGSPGGADQAADRAAVWLSERIDPTGRFEYRIDALGKPLPGYNVVRHAGALWALDQWTRSRPGHPQRSEVEHAADRAAGYLQACCLAAVPGFPQVLALWSVPEGEPEEAKLGGAGLALAAWAARSREARVAPDRVQLQALGRFLVYQQRPDGSFHSKYRDGRRQGSWVSLYYPGEAALGLIALSRLDPDPLWSRSAERALNRLAEDRQAAGVWPADHWAVIATAALLADPGYAGGARQSLLRHSEAIVATILAGEQPHGRLTEDPRTTPTAIRLEALLAALSLNQDPALHERWCAVVQRGSAVLAAAQIADGLHRGAMPRGTLGASEPRAGELRIDYAQHALSVWLGEEHLCP